MNLSDYIPVLNNSNIEYINLIQSKYNEFKRNSELPIIYYDFNIGNLDRMPTNIKLFYDNILDIINNRYSYVFIVDSYEFAFKLLNCILDHYFVETINKNLYLNNVNVINTKLLLEDYHKIIEGNSNDITPVLTYSNETLYRNLYKSPMIFWNNFHEINTKYEFDKIYSILQARYTKSLGNIYFVTKSKDNLSLFSKSFIDIMNIAGIVDMTKLDTQFIDDDMKGGDYYAR